ncbi:MAG: hypothetical protein QUS12_08340, partial [Methanosarcina sp.]|nr:hypothetical protein [Methanosarcina sp.]
RQMCIRDRYIAIGKRDGANQHNLPPKTAWRQLISSSNHHAWGGIKFEEAALGDAVMQCLRAFSYNIFFTEVFSLTILFLIL